MAYHYEMDSLSGEESVKFDKPPRISTTRVIIGDEAFQQARIKDPPKVFSSPVLLFSCLVAFCCSTCNGYDGSLLNPLLANKHFRDFFSVANVGIQAGTHASSGIMNFRTDPSRNRQLDVPDRLGRGSSHRGTGY